MITNKSAGLQCENYYLKDVTEENYKSKAIEITHKSSGAVKKGRFKLVGFCLMAKAELTRQLNGFDENFYLGNFEDNDFCLRGLLLKGCNAISEDCFVYHFGSQTF